MIRHNEGWVYIGLMTDRSKHGVQAEAKPPMVESSKQFTRKNRRKKHPQAWNHFTSITNKSHFFVDVTVTKWKVRSKSKSSVIVVCVDSVSLLHTTAAAATVHPAHSCFCCY